VILSAGFGNDVWQHKFFNWSPCMINHKTD